MVTNTGQTSYWFVIASATAIGIRVVKAILSKLKYPSLMKALPNDVSQYSRVPRNNGYFTVDTIPKGLLNKHTTKKGSIQSTFNQKYFFLSVLTSMFLRRCGRPVNWAL